MSFETKKYHFYLHFAQTTTIAILHPNFESDKNHSKCTKTVDNHQSLGTISFEFRKTILVI